MSEDTRVTSPATSGAAEPSTGELISRLSEQLTTLVRSEMQMAQAELSAKAKFAGLGIGLFGGAGVLALYGVGALIATLILAQELTGTQRYAREMTRHLLGRIPGRPVLHVPADAEVPAWLAALIVTVVLFAIAGVVALVGKKQVAQATPAAPQQTIDSVKRDVEVVKEARKP